MADALLYRRFLLVAALIAAMAALTANLVVATRSQRPAANTVANCAAAPACAMLAGRANR